MSSACTALGPLAVPGPGRVPEPVAAPALVADDAGAGALLAAPPDVVAGPLR